MPRVLLALAAVIITGQALALVLRRIGQPPVIGEVLAGILLGPSLFVPLGFDASSPISHASMIVPFLLGKGNENGGARVLPAPKN